MLIFKSYFYFYYFLVLIQRDIFVPLFWSSYQKLIINPLLHVSENGHTYAYFSNKNTGVCFLVNVTILQPTSVKGSLVCCYFRNQASN